MTLNKQHKLPTFIKDENGFLVRTDDVVVSDPEDVYYNPVNNHWDTVEHKSEVQRGNKTFLIVLAVIILFLSGFAGCVYLLQHR